MDTSAPRRSLAPSRAALSLLSALVAPALLVACRPELGDPFAPGPAPQGSSDPWSPAPLPVTIDPPAPAEAAPRVLRLRVALRGEPVDQARIALVRGEVGAAHLRQIAQGEISATLAKRIVPTQIWEEHAPSPGAGGASASEADGAGGAPPSADAIVVAPASTLVPGEAYALAIAAPATVFPFRIGDDDAIPLLARVWPEAGDSATDRVGVWCGDAPLPPLDRDVILAPRGRDARLHRGAIPGSDLGHACLHLVVSPRGVPGDGALPPPLLTLADGAVRLDPRPLRVDAAPRPFAPLACAPGELAFGPGCATVHDDRLEVRSPDQPAFWAIHGDGCDRVQRTGAGDPFILGGLTPATAIHLDVAALDTRGDALHTVFTTSMLAPAPHVIINEALANPLGPEPHQEWVELYNAGTVSVDLGGYTLDDLGGSTLLPPALLAPGAYALLVNASFVDDDGVDPAPAPDTTIVRVPKLGHAGLTNAGEPLHLRDPGGNVVSAFPAGPKPKAGMSLSRALPETPDTLAAGFAPALPTPGASNGS